MSEPSPEDSKVSDDLRDLNQKVDGLMQEIAGLLGPNYRLTLMARNVMTASESILKSNDDPVQTARAMRAIAFLPALIKARRP